MPCHRWPSPIGCDTGAMISPHPFMLTNREIASVIPGNTNGNGGGERIGILFKISMFAWFWRVITVRTGARQRGLDGVYSN